MSTFDPKRTLGDRPTVLLSRFPAARLTRYDGLSYTKVGA
jgi:hypothetical protein